MVKGAATGRYEPAPSFEEVKEEAMFDISRTDSEEFWLIQWPKDKLSVSDFHGKELKLHNDGKLGTLESSSGKSYDLVSFASQGPDAIVFLPSESETKAVGKISRRVSLIRYPDPEEFEKPSFTSLTPSTRKSVGSSRKTMSRFTGVSKRSSQGSAFSLGAMSVEPTPKPKKIKDENSLGRSSQDSAFSLGATSIDPTPKLKKRKDENSLGRSSQGSTLPLGAMSIEPTLKHKKRKDENSLGHSNVPGKASEGSYARGAESNTADGSHARGAESNTATEMPQTTPEKSKKKKKVKIVE